jgi:hypothetical protein
MSYSTRVPSAVRFECTNEAQYSTRITASSSLDCRLSTSHMRSRVQPLGLAADSGDEHDGRHSGPTVTSSSDSGMASLLHSRLSNDNGSNDNQASSSIQLSSSGGGGRNSVSGSVYSSEAAANPLFSLSSEFASSGSATPASTSINTSTYKDQGRLRRILSLPVSYAVVWEIAGSGLVFLL